MKTSFRNNDPIKFCDICGAKFHASQLRLQWDGLLACLPNRCWSPKHPFDWPLPVVYDDLTIHNARPEVQPDVFVAVDGRSKWGGALFIEYDYEDMRPNVTLADPLWNGIPVEATWGDID